MNGNQVELRGNEKWCEMFGENLDLPRFVRDEKIPLNGKWVYPPYGYQPSKKKENKKPKVAKNQTNFFAKTWA